MKDDRSTLLAGLIAFVFICILALITKNMDAEHTRTFVFWVFGILMAIGTAVFAYSEFCKCSEERRKSIANKAEKVVVCIGVAFPIIVALVIWGRKEIEYHEAISCAEDHLYPLAMSMFEELDQYRDSEYLYLYCEAKDNEQSVAADGIILFVAPYLEQIPDDYNGPLHDEIREEKEYVFSGGLYKERVELEAKVKEWQEQERKEWEREQNESSATSTYTHSNNYIYIPPTMYTDPDDYDSPEDFADDAWGLDFDDWDEAYEYWEDW